MTRRRAPLLVMLALLGVGTAKAQDDDPAAARAGAAELEARFRAVPAFSVVLRFQRDGGGTFSFVELVSSADRRTLIVRETRDEGAGLRDRYLKYSPEGLTRWSDDEPQGVRYRYALRDLEATVAASRRAMERALGMDPGADALHPIMNIALLRGDDGPSFHVGLGSSTADRGGGWFTDLAHAQPLVLERRADALEFRLPAEHRRFVLDPRTGFPRSLHVTEADGVAYSVVAEGFAVLDPDRPVSLPSEPTGPREALLPLELFRDMVWSIFEPLLAELPRAGHASSTDALVSAHTELAAGLTHVLELHALRHVARQYVSRRLAAGTSAQLLLAALDEHARAFALETTEVRAELDAYLAGQIAKLREAGLGQVAGDEAAPRELQEALSAAVASDAIAAARAARRPPWSEVLREAVSTAR